MLPPLRCEQGSSSSPGEDAKSVQAQGLWEEEDGILHHFRHDGHGVIWLISHPIIRIIEAKEDQQDKAHPQGGLAIALWPPASVCPAFDFIFSVFFLSVEAHFKHKP